MTIYTKPGNDKEYKYTPFLFQKLEYNNFYIGKQFKEKQKITESLKRVMKLQKDIGKNYPELLSHLDNSFEVELTWIVDKIDELSQEVYLSLTADCH